MSIIEGLLQAHKKLQEMRCPELVRNDLCRLSEKPSGRIRRCQREYGYECEEYNRMVKEE